MIQISNREIIKALFVGLYTVDGVGKNLFVELLSYILTLEGILEQDSLHPFQITLMDITFISTSQKIKYHEHNI